MLSIVVFLITVGQLILTWLTFTRAYWISGRQYRHETRSSVLKAKLIFNFPQIVLQSEILNLVNHLFSWPFNKLILQRWLMKIDWWFICWPQILVTSGNNCQSVKIEWIILQIHYGGWALGWWIDNLSLSKSLSTLIQNLALLISCPVSIPLLCYFIGPAASHYYYHLLSHQII